MSAQLISPYRACDGEVYRIIRKFDFGLFFTNRFLQLCYTDNKKNGVARVKSFKMLSVGILTEDGLRDFPLIDGIIINQENSHRMWILEMFIDQTYQEDFEKWMTDKELLEVKVVISYPENEPAAFRVSVEAIKQIGDSVSVLLKGRLKRARAQYAEQLLEELLGEGLNGDELLKRFESDMRSRPRLKKDIQESEA